MEYTSELLGHLRRLEQGERGPVWALPQEWAEPKRYCYDFGHYLSFIYFFPLETGYHYVVHAGLKLTI